MTDDSPGEVSFQAHVELLHLFLTHRDAIVEKIQELLNAQRKPPRYLQDRPSLSRLFEDCFFTLGALRIDQSRLRGQLEEAHWASGFRPRQVPDLHNDLIHPAEMMMRGFYCWQQTRWPGRNGRLRYAQTLFNVYLIRCLELMSMRLWDAGPGDAGDRLRRVQAVLDELWRSSPADQPVLLRDARWLIPLTQSPTTDALAPYFEVARHVAESFDEDDRIEIRKAGVQMIGGHLRSQIRHYCVSDGVTLDDDSVVRRTRTSNALDFALLIQGLVPLLEAYERARDDGDTRRRLELADAVLQGISPDPELFLNRVELLGAYSMIEYLFVAANGAERADYTPTGRRHVRLVAEYEALIRRLSPALYEDCPRFRPVEGAYSPHGAIYGTPSNLTEHMALKAIERDAMSQFAVEDVFTGGGADKLAWTNGWRQLPHIDPAMQRRHEYPHAFAVDIFDRIEHALRDAVTARERSEPRRSGRLFVLAEDAPGAGSTATSIPELAARYVLSSDRQIVAARKAEAYEQTQLLRDRQEGHFLVSVETSGGWLGVKKDILTEVLGAGHDVKIAGLGPVAADVLRLMCLDKLLAESAPSNHQASVPPSMLKA